LDGAIPALPFGYLTENAAAATANGVKPCSTEIAKIGARRNRLMLLRCCLAICTSNPFHDSAKVPLLVKASLEEWEGILKSPDSADQKSEFDAMQETCNARGVDAPYVLLSGSLKSAKAKAPDAQFVAVSGDLLIHNLDRRYRAAMKPPMATEDDQLVSAAFAEKTTVFVMKQMESTRFRSRS
jgi:hypothetical protein